MIRTSTDLCLHIENLKIELGLDTYTEAVVHFIENESDQEVDQIAKHLNPKIVEAIRKEALVNNNLKDKDEVISLV